jgi:hypothetical protein
LATSNFIQAFRILELATAWRLKDASKVRALLAELAPAK